MKSVRWLFILLLLLAAGFLTAQTKSGEILQSPGLDVVGFGYDVFGRYADMNSKKPYRLFELKETRIEPIGTDRRYAVPEGINLEPIVDHRTSEVEGSSVREYARSLSVNAGLGLNGFFFKASVETNINTSESGSTRRYYYTYMDSNIVWRVSLDTLNMDRLKSRLVPRVREDINKLSPGDLFAAYGTHYIAVAYLGGRADYTSTSVITEKISASDIRVAVKAEYKAISGHTEVNPAQKKALEESKTSSTLRVIGGNAQYVNDIRSYEQYVTWADGIMTRPTLCDFDGNSLRPIWELADSPGRKKQLEDAFLALVKNNPLPPELANLSELSRDLYMVENKTTGTYWDIPGYHQNAQQKGGSLELYPSDRLTQTREGADRFIKVIPHPVETDWVFFQPQHSPFVLDIKDGVKNPGTPVQLREMSNTNASVQFMLEPVENESNTFFIKSRISGLFLEADKAGKMVIQQPFSGSDAQKWIFRSANPGELMAPPAKGYYAVQALAGGKYWDFSGSYPLIRTGELQVWNGRPVREAADRHFLVQQVDGEWYSLRPRHLNGHVLSAPSKGRIITAWKNNANDQLWRFEYAGEPNTWYIRNRSTNEVIDLNSGKVNADGADVNSWPWSGADNQKWVLVPVPDPAPALHEGTFFIQLSGTDKYLDIPGTGNETNKDGANVQIWNMDGGNDRKVKFIPSRDGSGSLQVQFQNGNRMMDRVDKKEDGANVQLWQQNNKSDQQWRIFAQGNNTNFSLLSLYGDFRVLDVSASQLRDKGNGANVQVWKRTNSANQTFQFIYVDGPLKGKPFQGE